MKNNQNDVSVQQPSAGRRPAGQKVCSVTGGRLMYTGYRMKENKDKREDVR